MYFQFLPIGGMLIQRGTHLRGGANSRIYGMHNTLQISTARESLKYCFLT